MAARAGDQMRGVEALPVVARPDHLGGEAAAFGQRDQPLDGVAHHLLAVVHGLARGVDDAVVGVVGVDQPDVALVPDPVGAADDVVDDVGVDGIETLHRLDPLPVLRDQVDEVMTLDLKHVARTGAGWSGGALLRRGVGCIRGFHDLLRTSGNRVPSVNIRDWLRMQFSCGQRSTPFRARRARRRAVGNREDQKVTLARRLATHRLSTPGLSDGSLMYWRSGVIARLGVRWKR